MIERYSRPEMKRVWADENKFTKWLDIEIAVCDAWTERGNIPRNAMSKIKLAKCNLKRMDEILQETRHDMTAFLGSVAESLGDESRFMHLGLTSSDVMDTATSLQLVEAADILLQDIKELTAVLAQRAIEHKYTMMIGRTHGVHAEPITFGLKLGLWVEEMRLSLWLIFYVIIFLVIVTVGINLIQAHYVITGFVVICIAYFQIAAGIGWQLGGNILRPAFDRLNIFQPKVEFPDEFKNKGWGL